MDEKHNLEENYNPQRYNPVKREWKVIVFLIISVLLILGALAAGWMFAYYDRCSSSQLLCPLLPTLFTAMIVICVCIAVVKLISLYGSNLAKETEVLSTLYKEEEKRRIVKRNEEKAKEENNTKKEKQIANIENKK